MLKKRNIYEYLPLHVVIPFVASLAIGFVSVKAATVVLRPGMLPSQVRVWQKELPSDIRLEGETLAIDLVSLRDLPVSVKTLDMSALEIKGTTLENSSYMGRSCFSDGEVPPFALFATEVEEVLLLRGHGNRGGSFCRDTFEEDCFSCISCVDGSEGILSLRHAGGGGSFALFCDGASRTRFLWLLLAEEYSSSILCHLIGKRGVDEERSAEA